MVRGEGPRERAFELDVSGRRVPAVLWTPGDRPGPYPLVLAGHGMTLHKRALYPLSLARDLTLDHGIAVAAIDAPGHGERQPDRADAAASEQAWRAHWREHGASQISAELRATLNELERLPEIDAARVGYWGLSLGTNYGLGFLSEEPRVRAAVLGLAGLPVPGPRIAAYARRVSCPVFFIQQLDDKVVPRENSTALYDRLPTAGKALRSSPGGHMQVPDAVFREAYEFLARRLA